MKAPVSLTTQLIRLSAVTALPAGQSRGLVTSPPFLNSLNTGQVLSVASVRWKRDCGRWDKAGEGVWVWV